MVRSAVPLVLAAAALAGCASEERAANESRVFARMTYQLERQGFLVPSSSLVPIDPETLEPLTSRGLRLDDWGSGPVLSPDRRYAAFGGQFGQIIVADLVRMRVRPEIRFGGVYTYVSPVGWPRDDLIVATTCVSHGKDCITPRLVLIDSHTRRVRRTLPLGGPPAAAYDRGSRRAAILVQARAGRIGPAKLLVVEPTGLIHTTTIARIQIGNEQRGHWQYYRRAALVIERGSSHALVLGAGEPVAQISLRTLTVRYHRVRGLGLPRGALLRAGAQAWYGTANPSSEITRRARVLWPGVLAITGWDRVLAGTWRFRRASLPAMLLDTRTWQTRRSGLAGGQYAAGRILIDGRGPLYRGQRLIVAYDRAGHVRYKVLAPNPRRFATWQVFGNRLYVGLEDGRKTHVYNARTGKLLRRIRPTWVSPAFSWTPPR